MSAGFRSETFWLLIMMNVSSFRRTGMFRSSAMTTVSSFSLYTYITTLLTKTRWYYIIKLPEKNEPRLSNDWFVYEYVKSINADVIGFRCRLLDRPFFSSLVCTVERPHRTSSLQINRLLLVCSLPPSYIYRLSRPPPRQQFRSAAISSPLFAATIYYHVPSTKHG